MKRGEIYYVPREYTEMGHEERAGRPALIVSCDDINKGGFTVTIVYLTTQPKSNFDFHPAITCNGRTGYAICEQVTTVSASRIGDFIGKCDANEFMAVEAKIATVLGLDVKFDRTEDNSEWDETDDVLIASLTAERDTYKNCFEQLVNKISR